MANPAYKFTYDPWHRLPPEEMGKAVEDLVEGYKTEQAGRRTKYIRNLERYEGRSLGAYAAQAYNMNEGLEEFDMDRMRLVRSAVSSAVASIYAPQKPKPQFQTLGADWATRRKAYKLDRICEGILNQRQGRWINTWAFMTDAAVECANQGVAAIKVTADTDAKRICHDLRPLPDLFVDPAEGREPKSLFERCPLDEGYALKKWPEFENEIKSAKDYEFFGLTMNSRPKAARTIEIKYAWRLPYSESEPGVWCAVINGTVVEHGEWTAPAFPFVFLYWEPHRDGFWASGIGDEGGILADGCGELNMRLQERVRIASGKKCYYEDGTVEPNELTQNDALVAVKVQPGAQFPIDTVSPPFTETELAFLQYDVQNFWDSIGISQVSAAARREQGVSSGVAIMTLNDTKAGRQLVKSQRYEQAFVDLAHQYVWRLRELADNDPEFVVKWPGKAMLRQVRFKDADTDDDMFTVTVAPASSLPHDPAGRQEMVQQLYNSKLIGAETAKQLIGWPDLDSELNVENAESEYIDMLIEAYLDAEEKNWDAEQYQAPEGFIMNKAGAIRRFAAAWFRARIDQRFLPKKARVEAEFAITLLSRWITEMDALMQEEAQQAAALQATAAGAPAPPPQAMAA